MTGSSRGTGLHDHRERRRGRRTRGGGRTSPASRLSPGHGPTSGQPHPRYPRPSQTPVGQGEGASFPVSARVRWIFHRATLARRVRKFGHSNQSSEFAGRSSLRTLRGREQGIWPAGYGDRRVPAGASGDLVRDMRRIECCLIRKLAGRSSSSAPQPPPWRPCAGNGRRRYRRGAAGRRRLTRRRRRIDSCSA
jgi:hypothetical protein